MNNKPLPTDELFHVERRIARRADELSRQQGYDPIHALDHWRQAEREVWDRMHVDLPLAKTSHLAGHG